MSSRKISKSFRDREEELSFFRDLQKSEKDQLASLLQPLSEEFEANGNYGLYRMGSGGRKGLGVEFLTASGKNDYNWLKTPPATPLFPSLEMETNSKEQLIIQREIPLLQPLSRFAGNPEVNKLNTIRPKSPNPNQKLPQRHRTPTGRPSISSLIDKKNMKIAPIQLHDKGKQTSTPIIKSNIIQKNNSQPNFLASNLSKTIEIKSSSNTNTKARGVSPSLRQIITGSSYETPLNLRTVNRPSSTNRGRPTNQNPVLLQKHEITNSKNIRKQSCSPSVTRGRKVDHTQTNMAVAVKVEERGNRTQVLGSRMVDKFMNARISSVEDRQCKMKVNSSMNIISNVEERQGKVKLNGSMNETSGFGRLISQSSLDMALKHMEFQRETTSNIRKHGKVAGRKS